MHDARKKFQDLLEGFAVVPIEISKCTARIIDLAFISPEETRTRLEVIRVGGTTYTSREALQRFAAPPVTPTQPSRPESAVRQKQIDHAIKSLDEFLYKGKRRPNHQPVVPQQPLDRSVRETGSAPAPPR